MVFNFYSNCKDVLYLIRICIKIKIFCKFKYFTFLVYSNRIYDNCKELF